MSENKKRLDQINKALKDTTLSQAEQNRLRKEENELLKESLNLQSESLDLSSSLVDSLKEILGISTKRTTSDANLLKVNKEINKAILQQNKGIDSIEQKTKDILKNNKIIEKAKLTENSLEQSLSKQANQKVKNAELSAKAIQFRQKQLDKELAKASQGQKIDQSKIDFLTDEIAKNEEKYKIQLDSLGVMGKQLLFTKLNRKELEKQNAEREREKKIAEEIEEALGLTGKLTEMIGKIPGVGKIASSAMEKVRKEIELAAENGEEVPSKFQAMGMLLKEIGKNIKKALTDPLALIGGLVAGLFNKLTEVDKASGEFAKNQGISYKQTLAIRNDMNAIAMASKDVMVNSKELMKTQESLNKFFGSSVQFSGKLAEEMTSVALRTGMSEESQGLFALESIRSGKGVKDLLKTQTAQVMEMNKQKGLQMSVKQVQEAIGKTAKSLQLTFKGSVTELTKQVMQVKALGANMQQAEQIASSLLDFESSIANELEAELLLGQDINLEKARAAALEGDRGKMAEEVMKNSAIMNAFETKNVIAQEAAAKALGLSRDDE